MAGTIQRFNDAIRTYCEQPHRMRTGPVASRHQLETAFRQAPFIYGTVGPNALRRNAQPGANGLHGWVPGTGNPVARAVALLIERARRGAGPLGNFATQRDFNLYDPGPRTIALIRGGYQMMDMYYGSANDLFRSRNNVIAELVHYAMHFNKLGQRAAFDPNQSGRAAYMAAFPGAGEGWRDNHGTDVNYGQSATKEMSKIIRRGIQEFGGTLIFEGKGVFGAGIFDPRAYQGDTDLEAQALLGNFNLPQTPQVALGNGTLEFQWGGIPTVPTRAHFLTNWNYAGTAQHRTVNRTTNDPAMVWRDYVEQLMGPRHGLRPVWNNFANFPPGFGGQGHADFATMNDVIARLCVLLMNRGR